MARKKAHPKHENHERWLVSYADFITLLFAFFVVMFASSQTDKSKAQQVSDSVNEALEKGGVATAVQHILGGTVDDTGRGSAQMKGPGGSQPKKDPVEVMELLPSMKYLTKTLQKEIQDGKIDVRLEPRGLVMSLRQAAFFPSGEDNVDPGGFSSVEKIAANLRTLPNQIRLEGHTDAIPIHTARFRSNWELSAARGIAMMDLLNRQYGVARERMAIAGFADTVPLASNDTAEGRSKNRRVDIVILNQTLANAKPTPAAAATAPSAPGTAATEPKASPAGPPAKATEEPKHPAK